MDNALKPLIEKKFGFRANRNQLRDLTRLIFEINKREGIPTADLFISLAETIDIEKATGRNRFFLLKDALITRRFPLTARKETISSKDVFLVPVKEALQNNWQPHMPFTPEALFVENAVQGCQLQKNVTRHFPEIPVISVASYRDYRKENPFTVSELKKPIVFIVKENWDFIKPCPCTKHHLRCGYWILNVGFGCPFDCSYCFLQHYTNFPGIILPGNLDDFFDKFDHFSKTLSSPIRIGTGEFCDSLALDHITHYSKKLIPYFKNKNVLFELKTKSTNIDTLLTTTPADNIIISWSLNLPHLAKSEERATPPLHERIKAAKRVKDAGYRLGFHFDPLIHTTNWKADYQALIDLLYQELKGPFAWISLGTLRSNRELKTIVEQRFPESTIFYGELLLSEDKKLRYPSFLRQEMYQSLLARIRSHDSRTPVYLCMENSALWKRIGGITNNHAIEAYIRG